MNDTKVSLVKETEALHSIVSTIYVSEERLKLTMSSSSSSSSSFFSSAAGADSAAGASAATGAATANASGLARYSLTYKLDVINLCSLISTKQQYPQDIIVISIRPLDAKHFQCILSM